MCDPLKSSLEEIKVKPEYTFKLELTQEELLDLYTVMNLEVDPAIKSRYKLNEADFTQLKENNRKLFGVVRDAIQTINSWSA